MYYWDPYHYYELV